MVESTSFHPSIAIQMSMVFILMILRSCNVLGIGCGLYRKTVIVTVTVSEEKTKISSFYESCLLIPRAYPYLSASTIPKFVERYLELQFLETASFRRDLGATTVWSEASRFQGQRWRHYCMTLYCNIARSYFAERNHFHTTVNTCGPQLILIFYIILYNFCSIQWAPFHNLSTANVKSSEYYVDQTYCLGFSFNGGASQLRMLLTLRYIL